VGCCVDWLIEHWEHFNQFTRDAIERELLARMNGEDTRYPLGDDCDRAEWSRLQAFIYRHMTQHDEDEENPA
jgi:hypothetical protein